MLLQHTYHEKIIVDHIFGDYKIDWYKKFTNITSRPVNVLP